MFRVMTSPTITAALARVRRWLATTDLPRPEIAARASVDEKTLRLAARDSWNPTANIWWCTATGRP